MAGPVREWARANGWPDISDRGKLPEGVQEQYDAAHGDPLEGIPVTGNPPPPDYPAGMTDDDFAPGAGVEAEQRPRSIATPGPARGRGRLRGITGGKPAGPKAGKAAKPKARHPRVPVDRLITSAWGLLAQAARPLPPTSRVLTLQGPAAGVLLEGVVKNTVVDTVLQPLARLEQGGEVVFALAGPPLLATVMSVNPDAAPFLAPVLREALMTLIKVGGPAVAAAAVKGAADEAQYGQAVDAMLSMLFAPVPETPEQAQEQAEMMQQAQKFVTTSAAQGTPA
jgi:hypothetical protein